MSSETKVSPEDPGAGPGPASLVSFDFKSFPWWLVMLAGIIVAMAVSIAQNPDYNEAFRSILPWPLIQDTVENGEVVGRGVVWTRGIFLTLTLTVASFVVSMFLGLFIGLGRIAGVERGAAQARGPIRGFFTSLIRNVSTLYIEFVRGIPMLVFIFVIAQVATPSFADLITDNTAFELSTRDIGEVYRAGQLLSLFYAAFIAEVFRAGIQSVPIGQIEAGRAIGLSGFAIMRKVVLPQAIRNMLACVGQRPHQLDEGHLARLGAGRAGTHADGSPVHRLDVSISRRLSHPDCHVRDDDARLESLAALVRETNRDSRTVNGHLPNRRLARPRGACRATRRHQHAVVVCERSWPL